MENQKLYPPTDEEIVIQCAKFVVKHLSDHKKRVLMYLFDAVHSDTYAFCERNKYQIERDLGISHHSVYDSVRFLKKFGLIQGRKVGKTHTGLMKIDYRLTLFGFFICRKMKELRITFAK